MHSSIRIHVLFPEKSLEMSKKKRKSPDKKWMEPSIYPHQTKINSWVLGRDRPSSDSGGNQFCSFCSLDLNRLTTCLFAVMFHNEHWLHSVYTQTETLLSVWRFVCNQLRNATSGFVLTCLTSLFMLTTEQMHYDNGAVMRRGDMMGGISR